MIGEVDVNNDGLINVQEFSKMVLHEQLLAQQKQDIKAPNSTAKRRLRKSKK